MEGSARVFAALAVAVGTSFAGAGCYQGLGSGPGGGADDETGANSGDAGDESGSDDGGDGTAGIPDEPSVPTGWFRLSQGAYRNTVEDLMTYASDEGVGPQAFAALAGVISLLPADQGDDYVSHDQAMSQAHVDAYFEVGMRIGEEMTSSPERLAAFVGACASDGDAGNDPTCIDDFIWRFGRLAHRSPLSSGEFDFYRGVAYSGGDTITVEAVADLIAVMTSSPKFLYRVELGEEGFNGDETMVVSDFELASRASYLLWHSMPDPELLDVAAAGSLSRQAELEAQVDRLFRDPRAQRALATFFTHWLELDEQPNLAGATADPAYAALVGDQSPSTELPAEMAQDVVDSILYHVWTADDDVAGWFASPFSFARTPELAAIYGTAVWDGDSEPPTAPPARAGLLTRPAFLAATSMRSRPILRGSVIRRQMLCDLLPPPPPDAQGAAGSPDPTDGARAWTEEVTSSQECAGCHQLVNPLGFALEAFDPLGRERADELLFDEAGTLLATLPIDTTASLSVGGLSGDVSGPGDVVDMIVQSGRINACLASEYFSYAYGRDVDEDSADAALLDQLETLGEESTMADLLKGLALHPTFRVRGWEAQ